MLIWASEKNSTSRNGARIQRSTTCTALSTLALSRGVAARAGRIAPGVERAAQPVMDVALVREEVIRLAEVPRRVKRGAKLAGREREVPAFEGAAAEREMGACVLGQRLALAALPRLKIAPRHDRQRPLRHAHPVVQGAKLDRKVVARVDQPQVPAQLAEAPGG